MIPPTFEEPKERNAISDKTTDAEVGRFEANLVEQDQKGGFQDPAFSLNKTVPVHRWVPWVAGYSQAFTADAISKFTSGPNEIVLDPFAGVGTTLIEADRVGHRAIGFEINPYAAFVATVKLRAHRIDTSSLRRSIRELDDFGRSSEAMTATPNSTPPKGFKTRSPFYSQRVLTKVLLVMDFIAQEDDPEVADLIRLAFGATMVDYSNYSYEPSLGRKKSVGRAEIEDSPVIDAVVRKLEQMAQDADWYRANRNGIERPDGVVHTESFLDGYENLEPGSVNLLITSPPYMNNYHYNRNTRPQMYWLGLCQSPGDLRGLETMNFGTYWQVAREQDTVVLNPLITDEDIHQTVAEISEQNPDKGVNGGRGWANYAATYLNDCVRFLAGVKWVLRRDSTALVVVGNSIVQGIPVPTDRFMASIALDCGLEVVNIHTPRETRVGNSIINSVVRTKQKQNGQQLYESVLEISQIK